MVQGILGEKSALGFQVEGKNVDADSHSCHVSQMFHFKIVKLSVPHTGIYKTATRPLASTVYHSRPNSQNRSQIFFIHCTFAWRKLIVHLVKSWLIKGE